MLDVPNFFWDSEPTLHPLYAAVREYLEIKPRIQVLNERCRVFLDLAEILSDSIADNKMSRMYGQTPILRIWLTLRRPYLDHHCPDPALHFGDMFGSIPPIRTFIEETEKQHQCVYYAIVTTKPLSGRFRYLRLLPGILSNSYYLVDAKLLECDHCQYGKVCERSPDSYTLV